ncbi:LOW QUALITY PROTEIN: immunoglobulin superfamily member 22 [Alca torda]
MVTCSFEILAGESSPEFVKKPCPLATPKVKSKPIPNTTWKRENVPIEEGSRIFDSIFKKYVLRHSFVYKSASQDDTDNYKCVASNTHTDAIYTVSLIMTKEPKPLKVTAVFEICQPQKVQNFTKKFNGKELKWDDKYEITTSDDGLAYTMKIKGVLSSDFKELSVEAGDTVQSRTLHSSLIISKQRSIKTSFSHWKLSPKPGISPAQEIPALLLLYPANAKPLVLIYKVPTGMCHFFLPTPFPGVPVQFVSNLKDTQVKKKGKTCLECVLTSEDVTLKGINGQVIERSQYIMKHEGKRAELIVNAAELSDSGCCTEIIDYARQISSRDTCNHEEHICDGHALIEYPDKIFVVLNDVKVEGIWLNEDSLVTEESVLELFAARSITVKTKHTANIKVPFKAKPVPKVTWFKDGIEMTKEKKVVMEKAIDVLLTIKICVREDSGAIMLNLKNDCGSASGNPYLNFVTAHTADKLKPPQGKAEFLNTWGKCKMRWKAPKGNGGKQVTHFVIKKRMDGEKIWINIWVVESNYITFATEYVEEGKAYFRICAINSEGLMKPLGTEEIFAGEPISQLFLMWFHKPPIQVSQPQVVHVKKEDVTVTWNFPAQDGSSPVQGYTIKKRKKGSNLCVPATKELVQGTRSKVDGFLEDTDEFRVIAVNCAGPGLLKPPGLLKVVDFSSSSISLAWQEPGQEDVLSGYILEMAEDTKKWTKCTKIPISSTTYTVGGLQESKYYFTRAVNEAGMGEAVELQEGILAMPPSAPHRFDLTVTLKSHMVVRAGTAPYIHTTFPVRGEILQLEFSWTSGLTNHVAKGRHIKKREGKNHSRLIHSTERFVSDLYLIILKNSYREALYNIQMQTDYGVLKCDVSTAMLFTASETVYSNKYTVTGLLPGRKYFVIPCNDTEDTDPLDSQEQRYTSKDTDEDLAPENLSDLPKATKGATVDKRQEKYPEGLLS